MDTGSLAPGVVIHPDTFHAGTAIKNCCSLSEYITITIHVIGGIQLQCPLFLNYYNDYDTISHFNVLH